MTWVDISQKKMDKWTSTWKNAEHHWFSENENQNHNEIVISPPVRVAIIKKKHAD
jgi:hypothetical protein